MSISKFSKRMKSALLIAPGFLVIAAPAFAQPAAAEPAVTPASEDGPAIAEIIVTAQRREESVQRTPLAITAVTGEQLRAQNVTTLADVARLAPSVAISASGYTAPTSAVPIIYIRGIGQQDPSLQTEPGVPVYVDGVYVARSAGGAIDLPDIQRMEVLRGPQGTLFGKNTIGGAISLVTLTPGVNPETRVELTGGNYSLFQLRGVTNIKVSDTLGLTVAANYKHENGYGRRLDAARNVLGRMGDQRNFSERTHLRWTPTDNLTVDLSGDYSRYRNTANPGQTKITPSGLLTKWNTVIGTPRGTPVTQATSASGDYDNFSRNRQPANDDLGGASLTVAYDMGDTSLKSITAWRRASQFFSRDSDGGPAQYFEFERYSTVEQFTQEIQLGGKLLDGHVDYVTGVFYMREDGVENNRGHITPGLVFFPPPPNPEIGRNSDNTQITTNYAAFAQATAHLAPGLNLTVGGRYSTESKSMLTFTTGADTHTIFINNVYLKHTWHSFTPRVALDYQVTPDVLVYASASNGFKSGGFNGRAATLGSLTQFDPEKVWSYEAGLKSDLFDRHVRFNAAVFRADYSDIQLQRNVLINNVIVSEVRNVAASRIQGFEGELTIVPVRGLELSGNVGYAHNEYTEIQPGAIVTAGDKIPYAPQLTYSLSARYAIDLGTGGKVTPSVNYAWREHTYTQVSKDPAQFPDSFLPSYGLLSARLSYAPDNGPWSIAAYATNLSNKRYLISSGDSHGVGIVYQLLGRPREYGATVSFRF